MIVWVEKQIKSLREKANKIIQSDNKEALNLLDRANRQVKELPITFINDRSIPPVTTENTSQYELFVENQH